MTMTTVSDKGEKDGWREGGREREREREKEGDGERERKRRESDRGKKPITESKAR